MSFTFKTDNESAKYCLAIVEAMTSLFSIPNHEAIERINTVWSGLEIVGPDDPIYHEDEDFWAHTIYYGKDSYWWLDSEARKKNGLGPLVPLTLKRGN